MLFLFLFSAVFGKTEKSSAFSNSEISVKVNSNWLEKGGYEYELKITPNEDLIKDEKSDWQICFDTPMPTGQTQQEMEEAREEAGLALNFRNCSVFQFPGTHRCLRNCDSHLKSETIIYKITANPHSLAKSDFFGNFYTIQNLTQEGGNRTEISVDPIESTICTNQLCKTQEFVEDPTEESQLLNKNTSFWLPWTPEQRFERNLNENEASSDDSIAPVDSESLEIRSLHVDIARNFHGVETLEKILKEMKEVNMTHLHIHATDDEGWRIEIPELPELTTIGAHRCAQAAMSSGDHCMIPQYGSGAFIDSSQNGFLSVADYDRLLKTAFDLKISVITEINGPGHARAAIEAMKLRNNETTFLHDPNQTVFDIPSVQFFTDNVMNPCQESTWTFLEIVISHLKSVHEKYDDFHKIIHLGGDEVAHLNFSGDEKFPWENFPSCAEMIEKNQNEAGSSWDQGTPTQFNELQWFFTAKFMKIVKDNNFTAGAWEESFLDKWSDKASPFVHPLEKFGMSAADNVHVFVWNIDWESEVKDWPYQFANADYKVVMTPATHLYLDHPNEPHFSETGFYWATRFTDMKIIYGFQVYDLYKNSAFAMNWSGLGPGAPVPPNYKCDTNGEEACVKLESSKKSNIVGFQCSTWSESLITDELLLKNIFPRVYACAARAAQPTPVFETAETKEFEDDFNKWVAKVKPHMDRLSNDKTDFYLAPPGAKCENGEVVTNHQIPGIEVSVSDLGDGKYSAQAKLGFENSRAVEITCEKNEDDGNSSAFASLTTVFFALLLL